MRILDKCRLPTWRCSYSQPIISYTVFSKEIISMTKILFSLVTFSIETHRLIGVTEVIYNNCIQLSYYGSSIGTIVIANVNKKYFLCVSFYTPELICTVDFCKNLTKIERKATDHDFKCMNFPDSINNLFLFYLYVVFYF